MTFYDTLWDNQPFLESFLMFHNWKLKHQVYFILYTQIELYISVILFQNSMQHCLKNFWLPYLRMSHISCELLLPFLNRIKRPTWDVARRGEIEINFFSNSRNRLAFQEKREVYCVTAAHHDFFELVMTITDTSDDYLLSILLKKRPQGPMNPRWVLTKLLFSSYIKNPV